MLAQVLFLLGDVDLPGNQGLNSAAHAPGHFQPALVGVAFLAVGLVAFLGFDFFRQKRHERLEREKLERFRAKRLQQGANAPSNVRAGQ